MDDFIQRQAVLTEIFKKPAWHNSDGSYYHSDDIRDAVNSVKPQEPKTKTDKALNLLAEWAIECGFGYDNIPEEYEKYKDDIAEMGYAEGLVHIAKMESEG